MNEEKINAIVRELRKSAENLPGGKRRDINNKLDKIVLALRKSEDRDVMTHEDVVNNTSEFASQRRAIQAYLMEGHTLTTEDARKMFGASRLPNRIMEIEKLIGKAPSRRRITVKNRFGRNVSVCEYWIEKDN